MNKKRKDRATMTRRGRASGFTLAELMIVMLITMFVMYAATHTLGTMVVQFKQQAKISETNIASVLGLEVLRRDLHSAGEGLPWVDSLNGSNLAGFPYNEAVNGSQLMYGAGAQLSFDSASLNDSTTSAAPRAIATGAMLSPSVGPGPNGSDYLAIKSARVAINRSAGKVHALYTNGNTNAYSAATENLCPNTVPGNQCNGMSDWAIVISPDPLNGTSTSRLISSGIKFASTMSFPSANACKTIACIVIGIDNRGALASLRFPLNRADYYISYRNVPEKCAHKSDLNPGPGEAGFDAGHPPSDRTNLAEPGTGVLVKVVLDQADGDYSFASPTVPDVPDEIPVQECVADFKVVYGLFNLDGTGNITYDDGTLVGSYDAAAIRGFVREVRQESTPGRLASPT